MPFNKVEFENDTLFYTIDLEFWQPSNSLLYVIRAKIEVNLIEEYTGDNGV